MDSDQMTIYETEDGKIRVEVLFGKENVWLTQKLMADLFECSSDNVSLHLKNIYAERELNEKSTTDKFSVVQKEGTRKVKREITYYSLEAIIAVGYRINTARGTQFRSWAEKLDAFLKFNEQEILNYKGKVSHDVAIALAEKQYEVFRVEQDRRFESDFDQEVKYLMARKKRKNDQMD
jgi:hypothetical protein